MGGVIFPEVMRLDFKDGLERLFWLPYHWELAGWRLKSVLIGLS